MSDAVVEESASKTPNAEEKPKRTVRRRTTKKAENTDAASAASASEQAAASSAGSGAESAADTASGSTAGGVSGAEGEATPKRRGRRPKKAVEGEGSAASETTAQPEEAPAPKRRGRPRKADAEKAAESQTDKVKAANVATDEALSADVKSGDSAKSSAAEESSSAGVDSETPALPSGSSEGATSTSSENATDAHEATSSSDHGETVEVADSDSSSREERTYQRSNKESRKNTNRQHTKNNSYQKNASQKGGHYRQRRQHQQNRREPVVPQTSKEDLAKLKVAELRARADELEVDHKGLKKADLVEAVFTASIAAEGFKETAGILDVLSDGYGFLRTQGYLPSEEDVYVGMATIRRNNLRKGDYVTGQTRPARPNEKYAALQRIDTVNDVPLEELGKRVRFADLTPVFPDERLVLEHGRNSITARVIDLCAPIGKGQRGLIVSPPKAGKTTILKDIAASIAVNNPEVHLMCLLVDERPEEVTDMERSIKGEVISSTFDMPCENHVAVSEMVIERAKRLVETGKDVVILLDSLTRLARAYNLAQPASGRILSGGVDSTALYPPKKFLGAARNIEGGGSLTILASALIETGSKMDEVIFEEFKGTGNMEVKLDRQLADRRIFPAIDPVASGTRREDLLLDPQEAPLIWAVRRILANRNNTERAMDSLIKSLQQTNNNQEFLMRAAKKAQGHHFEEGAIEF